MAGRSTPERKALGHRLQARRMELDLDQEDVAASIGCSRNTISTVETGGQGLAADRLTALCRLLGVDSHAGLQCDKCKELYVWMIAGKINRFRCDACWKAEERKAMEEASEPD